MFKILIISVGILLNLPNASEAKPFCRDWPVFQLEDGTHFCAALFGPLTGEGFTAATGKFHMLSEYDQNERAHVKRGLALCGIYRKEIVAQTRSLGMKRHDYVAIIQTWKIGEVSNSVDKVQNFTVLADNRCREVKS